MVHFVQEDEARLVLSPLDLISLKDAGVVGGAFAMRELDQAHIESLVLSDAETWPPIQTTLATCGYIVLDGYHRWAAARVKQLKAIRATSTTYHSDQEVIEAAFRANLQHGLRASVETKGDYAYWLHLTYPALEQTEIARRVGLTQGAVSKAIARREEEAKRATQQEESPSPEERRKQIKQSARRLTRVASQFLAEVEGLDEQELTEILRTAVKRREDRARLARIGLLFGGQSAPGRQYAS